MDMKDKISVYDWFLNQNKKKAEKGGKGSGNWGHGGLPGVHGGSSGGGKGAPSGGSASGGGTSSGGSSQRLLDYRDFDKRVNELWDTPVEKLRDDARRADPQANISKLSQPELMAVIMENEFGKNYTKRGDLRRATRRFDKRVAELWDVPAKTLRDDAKRNNPNIDISKLSQPELMAVTLENEFGKDFVERMGYRK